MTNSTDENDIVKLILETVRVELNKDHEKFIDEQKQVNADTKEESGMAKTSVSELVKTGMASIDNQLKNGKISIEKITAEFIELAGDTLNTEAGKKLTKEYIKLADKHEKQEKSFQFICGGSIAVAILFLMFWVMGFIPNFLSESNYFWLPIATITSLFLFITRWSARISYRHGLESKRLNQYALDLSTMPAYFNQSVLNDNDKNFAKIGMHIIQSKSGKLFGNVERFNEQHSHSFMELIFKYLERNKNEPIDASDEFSIQEKSIQTKNLPPIVDNVPPTDTEKF